MKRSSVAVIGLALVLLTGCGQVTANTVLDRMHATLMQELKGNLDLIEVATKTTMTTDITLETSPMELFDGSFKANLGITQAMDVTNPGSESMDLAVKANVNADLPGGTLGNRPGLSKGDRDKGLLDVSATVRATGKVLYVQISKLLVSLPTLPNSIVLPDSFATSWYGATFQEINDQFKKTSSPGQEVPTMEAILQQASGGKINKEAMLRLYDNLHVWKGIALLPEKDGNYQVRVETDKETLKKDLDTLVVYMAESIGPSWSEMQKQSEMLSKIEQAKRDIDTKVGGVKGVISAEKETFKFRGFDGDVLDQGGKVLGHITLETPKNGDILISITDMSTPAEKKVIFVKKGTDFTLTASGATVAKGTISPSSFTLSLLNPSPKDDVALHVNFPISKVSQTDLQIENGTVELPKQEFTLNIRSMGWSFSNKFKDAIATLDATALLKGKQLFTVQTKFKRNEAPSIAIEKPAKYLPFQQLQNDLTAAVMGSMQPAESAPSKQ